MNTISRLMTKTVLVIGGSDSGGGAGIAADLKTLAACGVHGACAITALTAQNTLGVDEVLPVPPEFVERQIEAVVRDMRVEWAKTGMLWSSGTIATVRKTMKRYGMRAVVDPVTVSATGCPLMERGAEEELWRLISSAELVTPNIHEAERLSGMKIRSLEDMRRSGRKIVESGARAVLIKGGHLKGKIVVDVLITRSRTVEIRGERVTSEPLHGTGCSLASAIAAGLARGLSLERAVGEARRFIELAIKFRISPGRGVKPVNPLGRIMLEAEKGRCMEEVARAAELLCSRPEFAGLIPEVGTNIAMALPFAGSPSEVIGLSGRIVRVGGKPHATGIPVPGGSSHVARVVLAAMKHDPEIRAGMNIRYDPKILSACRKLGLTLSSFDRSREPAGARTMEWGTEHAIRRSGGVPSVIYDTGGPGKEAMIRLLGRTALEVAGRALMIARTVED